MNHPFVAVVTGSSSGIGRAVARAFATQQSAVVIHGHRNLAGLQETAREVQNLSTQPALAVVGDITDRTSVHGLVQAAFARHGYVDAWVHAAGADVLTGAAKEWSFATKLDWLWKTDVAGMIQLSRAVVQRMLKQPERPNLPVMIHIGWDQANTGMEGDSGQYFCPIKAAVAAFSKSLAKSVAPRMRVNCVAPGWIKTEWGTSRRGIDDESLGYANRRCQHDCLAMQSRG
jgi:3-oxoacyl-[acyl-carrier protein] reductase